MDMEKNAVCRAIDYTGRNVIVTGGASGAGVGIAHRFAEAGANVAITYHSNGAAAAEKVEALRAFGAAMGEAVGAAEEESGLKGFFDKHIKKK